MSDKKKLAVTNRPIHVKLSLSQEQRSRFLVTSYLENLPKLFEIGRKLIERRGMSSLIVMIARFTKIGSSLWGHRVKPLKFEIK